MQQYSEIVPTEEMVNAAIVQAMELYDGYSGATGRPLINEICDIVGAMDSPEEQLVALYMSRTRLPIVSDEQLASYGPQVQEAITALTFNHKERTLDFVRRTQENAIAKKVKIASLKRRRDSLTELIEILLDPDYFTEESA